MTLFHIAFAYVWHRRFLAVLNAASVAVAMALVLAVVTVRHELEHDFLRQAGDCDLIVGASGSEIGLVLAGLFHAETPRGNIPLRTFESLGTVDGVVATYPFALGDVYREARIVGTSREFLDQERRANGTPLFPLQEGRTFEKDFELVAGAAAARRLGLKLGDQIVGSHAAANGFSEHRQFPYTIVGILAPTGGAHDRALFTTLASYWTIHGINRTGNESAQEVTVALLRTRKPAVFEVQQQIQRQLGVLAVRPVEVLQRMFVEVLEPLERLLLIHGWAVGVAAAASIVSSLYLATLVHRRDLAILRALGATPLEIFVIVFFQALILLVAGCGFGVVASQVLCSALATGLQERLGVSLEMFRFSTAQALAVAGMLFLGLAAALLPAFTAYRRDVASSLSHP